MRLVVGLGNPGSEYASTRHNAGFMAVDELHARLRGGSWQKKFKGELAEVRDGSLGDDGRLLLVKPQTYMNLVGECVGPAATFFKIAVNDIIVVHDELDLPLGTLRLKVGGGHGGHNGLRSIIEQLGGRDFLRVRCGIGRPQRADGDPAALPPDDHRVTSYVLGDFARDQLPAATAMQDRAADAVEAIVRHGIVAAMNQFNSWEGATDNG